MIIFSFEGGPCPDPEVTSGLAELKIHSSFLPSASFQQHVFIQGSSAVQRLPSHFYCAQSMVGFWLVVSRRMDLTKKDREGPCVPLAPMDLIMCSSGTCQRQRIDWITSNNLSSFLRPLDDCRDIRLPKGCSLHRVNNLPHAR